MRMSSTDNYPPPMPSPDNFDPPVTTRRDDLFALREELNDHALGTMRKRNAQYASEANPIANYEAAARAAGCSPTAYIIGRMAEKLERMRRATDGDDAYSEEIVLEEARELMNLAALAAFADGERRAGRS